MYNCMCLEFLQLRVYRSVQMCMSAYNCERMCSYLQMCVYVYGSVCSFCQVYMYVCTGGNA